MRDAEIYFYDDNHPAEKECAFHISDNQQRSIVIICAGIEGKREIDIKVEGKNANATVVIMPLLWKAQSLELVVNQYHAASNSKSNVKIVGAIADTACLRATVISKCQQNVHDVSAQQQINILLLSPDAQAIAMPCISAINMNVRCKHGSALRSFDSDQHTYLKSRGIDETQARAILCKSFLLSWMNSEFTDCDAKLIAANIQRFIAQLLCAKINKFDSVLSVRPDYPLRTSASHKLSKSKSVRPEGEARRAKRLEG